MLEIKTSKALVHSRIPFPNLFQILLLLSSLNYLHVCFVESFKWSQLKVSSVIQA